MSWFNVFKEETIYGGWKAAYEEWQKQKEMMLPKHHANIKTIMGLYKENKMLLDQLQKFNEERLQYYTDVKEVEKRLIDETEKIARDMEQAIKTLPKQAQGRIGDLYEYPKGPLDMDTVRRINSQEGWGKRGN